MNRLQNSSATQILNGKWLFSLYPNSHHIYSQDLNNLLDERLQSKQQRNAGGATRRVTTSPVNRQLFLQSQQAQSQPITSSGRTEREDVRRDLPPGGPGLQQAQSQPITRTGRTEREDVRRDLTRGGPGLHTVERLKKQVSREGKNSTVNIHTHLFMKIQRLDEGFSKYLSLFEKKRYLGQFTTQFFPFHFGVFAVVLEHIDNQIY